MQTDDLPIANLSDADLLREVQQVTKRERAATAQLIAALGELDARRLYLGQGCSSLFTYCTQVLHLSEHAAYGRIEAARASRKWPVILEHLADGSLHLTAISLLAPHLTADNQQDVLASARHKSKRQVEEIVAALRPQRPVPSSVRKLPSPKAPPLDAVARSPAIALPVPAASEVTPKAHAVEGPVPRVEVKPLAPERYKVQFTASRETYQKLREAQNLLRHRTPNGDVATLFDRALTLLLAELRKSRHAAVTRPRTPRPCFGDTRHVSASVKRAVWERDDGRCAFVGAVGRCTERGFLEYHHRVPFADGGATTVENLELRCRAHNASEADRWFGVGEGDVARERPAGWH